MSSSASNVPPPLGPLGGLEALVAAASAAGQAGAGPGGSKRKRSSDHPAQSPNPDDMTSAVSGLFNNPIFVNALAFSLSTQSAAATSQSPAPPHPPHPYAAMIAQNAPQGAGAAPSAPAAFKQTRSGRISRPPAPALPGLFQAFQAFQAVSAGIDSGPGAFDALLSALASGHAPPALAPPAASPSAAMIDPALAGVGVYPAALPLPTTSADSPMGDQGGPYAAPHPPGGHEWAAATQTLADAAEEQSMSPDGHDMTEGELPAWPLPPGGPGGRKNMPKDEMLARRRARNRVAAVESRRRKKSHIDGLENRLKEREFAYQVLQLHCKNLEQQVEQLQQVVTSAGLPLPSTVPVTNPTFVPSLTLHAPSVPQPPGADDAAPPTTLSGFDDSPLPPFDMFFNIDMDGEDDGEFLPPSSPANESDGEESRRKKKKSKGKKRAGDEDEEEDDDEFVDEDVEDEDLFLPIEDVPVPPDAHMDSAILRSLGVDNQEQLGTLVNKMVAAGREDGVTNEILDKLKVLLGLMGANGGRGGKP